MVKYFELDSADSMLTKPVVVSQEEPSTKSLGIGHIVRISDKGRESDLSLSS